MELSTTREATSCAVIREFRSILWNPKVHYRIHKSPLLAIIKIKNQYHCEVYYSMLSIDFLIFIMGECFLLHM
jgi:hypothetical protein